MTDKFEELNQNRRPLKIRDAGLATKCARNLSDRNITPNQISIASIGFAILAALSLFFISYTDHLHWLFALFAAFFIQCRLLCNLFDGMVAIEGGKTTASGELFNDIPDRIADPLILVCVGYAITDYSIGMTLGWLAGLLAVMTAYIRTLSTSIGAPTNYQGPMAKQHRMALITIACIITSIENVFFSSGTSFLVALIVIIIGCVFTCYKRSQSAYQYLENQARNGNQ